MAHGPWQSSGDVSDSHQISAIAASQWHLATDIWSAQVIRQPMSLTRGHGYNVSHLTWIVSLHCLVKLEICKNLCIISLLWNIHLFQYVCDTSYCVCVQVLSSFKTLHKARKQVFDGDVEALSGMLTSVFVKQWTDGMSISSVCAVNDAKINDRIKKENCVPLAYWCTRILELIVFIFIFILLYLYLYALVITTGNQNCLLISHTHTHTHTQPRAIFNSVRFC